MYPRASNQTDFDVLRAHPQVDCQFVTEAADFKGADLIILPGSKSVRDDLAWLKTQGWEKVLQRHLRFGGKLLGICGGFQMLGETVGDPIGVESSAGLSEGLGFLSMQTTLAKEKVLRNVSGVCLSTHAKVSGYEIHAGESTGDDLNSPLFAIKAVGDNEAEFMDGAKNADDSVRGTYIHGVFDQPDILAAMLCWAGLSEAKPFDYNDYTEQNIEKLADAVEEVLPLNMLKKLLSMGA